MADVELLPLPEWAKRDDLGGLVPSEVRAEMRAYTRANMEPLRAENERLRAEVERLNRLLGRIVEGDGDSTLTIRAGTDAFAAARECLSKRAEQENKA